MTISSDPTETPLGHGVSLIQGHRVRPVRGSLYAIDEPNGEGGYGLTVVLTAKSNVLTRLDEHHESGKCAHPEVFSELQ